MCRLSQIKLAVPGPILATTRPRNGMARQRGRLSAPPKETIILAQSPDGRRQRPGARTKRRVCLAAPYSSSGSSFSSASENTGPSTHTYFGPTLQRPQMPMPHFMRFSRVV